ncbi:MAG: ATP-binding protein [Planctomycetota bacterium]
MTLTNRVSLFFLAALGLVLASYSSLLYGFASNYLSGQLDQRLISARNTLVAAIEVEVDDVKWEPSDHTIAVGTSAGPDSLAWVITDSHGRIVDQSPNPPVRWPGPPTPQDILEIDEPTTVGDYRVLRHTARALEQKSDDERDAHEFDQLTVTVAVSTTSLRSTLGWFLLTLCLVSTICWTLAAVLGRRYCRRALRPVEQMAKDARCMSPGASERRLGVPNTGDELEDLAEAFNHLVDRLHEALERESRFTGDAAHQLRTPVTVLLGQIEVARRKPRSVEEYQRALDLLHGQADELRRIIESLLFLARSSADAAVPAMERVEMSQWLQTQLSRWLTHPRAADIELSSSNSHNAFARVSPTLLGQLLDNLLENALKYSEDKTPVRISLEATEDAIELAVADRGMGIPSDEVGDVFNPFYRSEMARRQGKPGSGLGLSVASRIALTLGGELRVESEPGRGSIFRLILPREPDELPVSLRTERFRGAAL